MQYLLSNPFFVGAVALITSAVLTYGVREVARLKGYVAKPKSDRWHKRPTAMHGGVGIFLATVLLYALFVGKEVDSLVLMGAATFLFLVGFADDILDIKPYQKLIGQLMGAVVLVGLGLRMPLTGNELLDTAITVFWLIGITNAINLLDNMDGLAAGIAAIAAVILAIGLAANGQANETLFVAVFVGALLGFLIFNFNPASIFMGDSGSMFIGFLLAGSVLLSDTGGRSRGVFSILAVPALILFVPIFDTTFVTVLRKLWGRKASQGGRDHTSHRLVALGLTERAAVLMLYAFAAIAGVLSLFVTRLGVTESIALIAAFTTVLVIVGVYLSQVKVYDEADEELAVQNNAAFSFLVDVSYKRRIFEVLLDVILITLAYYASYVMLFGSVETGGNWDLFIKTLPILIVVKLSAFLVSGVYRGVWRYTGITDFITFGKGIALGSVVSVLAILLLYRFQNFSRMVFVLDGIILLFFIAGSRMAFRLIREILPLPNASEGRRVLIYGAGDGGEMLLRELRNNREWNYLPVGFVDDDPHKRHKVIGGLKVFEENGSLADFCRQNDIQEVLISFRNIDADKLSTIREACRESHVTLKRAFITIESLDFE